MQNDIKCSTDTQSENDKILIKSIENIAKREGFLNFNIKITKISKKGDGYLADPCEVEVKGKTVDGDKELNLYVKNIIKNLNVGDSFSINEAYDRECYFYKELSKIFEHLQEGIVPIEDRLKMVRGYQESTSEAIILDNKSKKGYKCPNRMDIVPLKFLELALEQLAKIHGLGFVMQSKMPEYFKNNIVSKEYPLNFNKDWGKIARWSTDLTIKQLNPDSRKKAEGFVSKLFRDIGEYFKDKTTIRTLCHGDFRMMNILKKEINGEITEVIPIDYQIINYGSPVTDLFYFLYGCTEKDLRKEHFDRLINLYYDHLTKFLKYFEMDVDKVYPRIEFEAAMDKRADFGLMLALYFYPFFFAPEGDVPELNDIMANDYKLDDQVIRMVEDIIEELEEKGFLLPID